MPVSGSIVEVFASLQGEGLYCGEPQIFVRLGGCPLRCLYCDTPQGLEAPAEWIAHLEPARRGANPVLADGVADLVRAFDVAWGAARTISVTGGEPLAQPDFLAELLPRWRGERRVHLETAGVHPAALERVAAYVDHVSMDWKLASTMERGRYDERHAAFLDVIVARGLDACVKFVITPAVGDAELAGALELVLARASRVPIFLQPATPDRAVPQGPSAERMDQLARLACARGAAVRVLPQVHKLLGIR
ncbi:MAG: 7-carboxy-7-deazaguanine synthase QueE [Planctomycetes bacterium]|nr:7-carboxy-7-deazaguanine synthase QueE [Planctomycetota bacterium]